MKRILINIIIILFLLLAGCGNNKDDISNKDQNFKCIQGKIIEVREKNEILIEITKERGGYEKEDKVLIGYTEYYWIDPKNATEEKQIVAPKVNDEVGIRYQEKDVKEKDGYDYIPYKSVEKY
jgi:hypothetical protein